MLFTVLLDADVIHALPVCAAILDLREYDLFAVKWSRTIFDEARRSMVRRGLPSEKVDARLRAMDEAFPDADVTDFAHVISGLSLPDPDDRHVLAAAIVGQVEQIVTNNVKHFPSDALHPHGIEAVTADTFLLNALDLYPEIAINTTRARAAKLRNPAIGIHGVLKALSESGAPQFSSMLAASLGVLS